MFTLSTIIASLPPQVSNIIWEQCLAGWVLDDPSDLYVNLSY